MKEEIEAAASFLVRLVDKAKCQDSPVTQQQLDQFRENLIEQFHQKYQDHWFPDRPTRGQAYRCIRLNGNTKPDEIIEQAAKCCGLKYTDLNLPVELTLWVDPKEVSCRFGEHKGSYCTVASFASEKRNSENAASNNKSSFRATNERTNEQNSSRLSGHRSPPGTNISAPAFKPSSPPGGKVWYPPGSPPPVYLYGYRVVNRASRYLIPVRLAYVQPRYPWNNFNMVPLVTA